MKLRNVEGVSILIAEQNAARALAVVDYGYVLENGQVAIEGPAQKLREDDDIRRFYLGLEKTLVAWSISASKAATTAGAVRSIPKAR